MDTFLKTVSAIKDETRVLILRFIDLHGEVCVCDIEQAFKMIQSRISRHLKILKEAGFLQLDRRGRWAYYSLSCPLDRFKAEIINQIRHLGLDIPGLQGACHEKQTSSQLSKTDKSLKENTMQRNIKKTTNGVKISFTGMVQKHQIVKMVENCTAGQCECMSDETKKKITDMKVSGEDGSVELDLNGDIAKEEIETALQRSKILNPHNR